jgi:Na+(H+)/acetate symporter ActP
VIELRNRAKALLAVALGLMMASGSDIASDVASALLVHSDASEARVVRSKVCRAQFGSLEDDDRAH